MKKETQIKIVTLLGAAATLVGLVGPLQAKPAMPKPSVAPPISLTGIVVGAPRGGEVVLRANGAIYHVHPLASVDMSAIKGGDQARAFGRPSGLLLNYANVRVLVPRASTTPSDYNDAPATTIEKTDKRP